MVLGVGGKTKVTNSCVLTPGFLGAVSCNRVCAEGPTSGSRKRIARGAQMQEFSAWRVQRKGAGEELFKFVQMTRFHFFPSLCQVEIECDPL